MTVYRFRIVALPGNFSVLVAIQKRAPQARPGAAQRHQAARSAASGPDRRCGPLGPYIEPVILALFPLLQFSLWAQKYVSPLGLTIDTVTGHRDRAPSQDTQGDDYAS